MRIMTWKKRVSLFIDSELPDSAGAFDGVFEWIGRDLISFKGILLVVFHLS